VNKGGGDNGPSGEGEDGAGNGERRRAAHTFCGECKTRREEHEHVVRGICDLAADRLPVAAALCGGRDCRGGGEEPAAALERAAVGRFERGAANQLWQMDFKSPLGWDAPVGPLSGLDDHRR
jgi:hypothetical protein